MTNLIVLYPQPTDEKTFESDYTNHLKLLHEKTGIPNDVKPYTVTKFLSGPSGTSPFYQMFSMPFDSLDALNEADVLSRNARRRCRCQSHFFRGTTNYINWSINESTHRFILKISTN